LKKTTRDIRYAEKENQTVLLLQEAPPKSAKPKSRSKWRKAG